MATSPLVDEPRVSMAQTPVSSTPVKHQPPKLTSTDAPHVQKELKTAAEVDLASTVEKTEPVIFTTSTPSTVIPESTPTTPIASSELKSSKIIYSSGEVNARFLKKDSGSSVPAVNKPTSGIQKILDIASNLKYEDSALGDLREIKNEFLSLPRRELVKAKL